MVRFAEIVDWNKIRDTVLFGFIAGVAITAAYGFGLLGIVKSQESYQAGRVPRAIVYGVVAVLGVLVLRQASSSGCSRSAGADDHLT